MNPQINYYKEKLQFELDPSDLFQLLEESSDYVILDARKKFAYQKEHIPTAINLPHRQMNEESTEAFDKSKIYVCYCDGIGCNASTKAALKMTELGFKTLELIGGIEWWKKDGFATNGSVAAQGSIVQCAC